jgi:hypothetical protein
MSSAAAHYMQVSGLGAVLLFCAQGIAGRDDVHLTCI